MCERELNRLDLLVNVKKSSCMRVGPRHDAICAAILCDDNTPLQWYSLEVCPLNKSDLRLLDFTVTPSL